MSFAGSLLLRHHRSDDKPKTAITPSVAGVAIETIGESVHRGGAVDDTEYLLFNNRIITSDIKRTSDSPKAASVDPEGLIFGAMNWSDHEREKILPMVSKEEYTVRVNKDVCVQVRVRTLCLSSHVCPDKVSRRVAGGSGPASQRLYRFENRPCILALHDLGDERSTWLQWMRLVVDIFEEGIFDIIMLEVDAWRKDSSLWFAYLPIILPHLLRHLGVEKTHVLADGFGSGCFIRCLTQWWAHDDAEALKIFSRTTHLLHNCDYPQSISLGDGRWVEVLRRAVEESQLQLWLTWQDSVHPSKVTRTRSSVRNRMTMMHRSLTGLAEELRRQRRIYELDFDPIIVSEVPSSVMRTEVVGSSAGKISKTTFVNLIDLDEFAESVREFFREGERTGMRLTRECFREDLLINAEVFGAVNRIVNEIPDGGAILPALLPEEEKRERFPPQPSARALALERQRTEATKRLVKKKEVESELRGLAEDYEGERSLLRHLIEEISVEEADKAVVVVLEGPAQ
ncbi:hypothetical protein FOZ63_024462 [Perkinsus olseni]|uniref:Uncharacterized protein n=1 Tax=Perkinsus olseni TaxID=32597 RepID=A0A7J6R2Y1_PEROL|nr:hypothetical protein FOZ63_024462 [Perkinsus olseni]